MIFHVCVFYHIQIFKYYNIQCQKITYEYNNIHFISAAGLENFLDDLEFMLDKKPSVYWRICWFIVTPLILITIFIYTVATLSPLTYGGRSFPLSAHAAGWMILCIGVVQIPLWMLINILKNRELSFIQV